MEYWEHLDKFPFNIAITLGDQTFFDIEESLATQTSDQQLK